jgi:hypothetical protein
VVAEAVMKMVTLLSNFFRIECTIAKDAVLAGSSAPSRR